MNALCALHHFCDLHGPQTLLCTEGRTYIQDYNDNDNEELKTYYSQFMNAKSPQEKTQCQSCTLSSEGVVITTTDYSHHMQYVSSSSTPNAELFKTIRHACVRSLTIEKPTDSEHPIVFGDDQGGYCLSFSFVCKDFYARGSQRRYSLCYLCPDKYHLLSVMCFIEKCMKQIIFWLQYDASQTYSHEEQIQVSAKRHGIITATSVRRVLPCQPVQRMLSDIVCDSKLIYRAHALFVWILRTTNSAIQESLFEALPVQERIGGVHNQQIVKYRSETTDDSTDVDNDTYNNSNSDVDDDDDDDYDSLEYHFASYGFQALRLFRKFIMKLDNLKYLHYILFNWLTGNQLIIKYQNRTEDKDFIRAFISVFRLLLPDNCCHLMETTSQIASCTANLILLDMDALVTTADDCQQYTDKYSIAIRIIFDSSDEQIHLVELETQPSEKFDRINIFPTYVKVLVDLLTDSHLDDDTLEAIIIQQKNKYLNKAKLYFQLGRCPIASFLSMNEHQQMNILKITNPNDLLIIRFWQRGLSSAYKNQIRMMKQDDNQQRSVQYQKQ
ncbi:unnamed protein product [Adineta ricciae]|uniref:Folliculin n=1 Tax=Adineta ricciae TaxID=249248 RepID=A0A813S5G5_ADIRI|nr:unnamed protein product [Adineta ricciae]